MQKQRLQKKIIVIFEWKGINRCNSGFIQRAFENVVALAETALTPEQIRLVKRLTKKYSRFLV